MTTPNYALSPRLQTLPSSDVKLHSIVLVRGERNPKVKRWHLSQENLNEPVMSAARAHSAWRLPFSHTALLRKTMDPEAAAPLARIRFCSVQYPGTQWSLNSLHLNRTPLRSWVLAGGQRRWLPLCPGLKSQRRHRESFSCLISQVQGDFFSGLGTTQELKGVEERPGERSNRRSLFEQMTGGQRSVNAAISQPLHTLTGYVGEGRCSEPPGYSSGVSGVSARASVNGAHCYGEVICSGRFQKAW